MAVFVYLLGFLMAAFVYLPGFWRALCFKIKFYINAPNRLMAQEGIDSDFDAPNQVIAREESPIQKYHDPTECLSILACTGIDNSQRQNLLSATISRAIPNGRLAQAFGIDNAFTATNENDRTEFQKKANQKLEAQNEKTRKEIAALAKQILHEKIQISDAGQMKIHLVSLVQTLSLKISLHVLFQKNPLALDDEAVSSLAWTINAIWILSKNLCPNQEQLKFHQDNLSKDLKSLLPSYSFTCPKDTPMNFIIPAYETLWRVVLLGFIEIAFRHPSSTDLWRSALAKYMAQPTSQQFSKPRAEPPEEMPSISAKDLAMEALRLYPPTKRVYRTFQYRTCPELVTVAADIEHVHRNPKLWGPDSTMYVPGRWASEPQNLSKIFLPFGGKPMVCPAKGGFGPMIIAMLLAVLVNEFNAGEWKLEGDEAGETEMKKWMEKPSQPLDSSRRAHASLYLCRKRDS